MTAQDRHTEITTKNQVLHLLVEYKERGIQTKALVDKPTGTMKLLAFDDGTRLKEHTAPYDVHLLILEGETKVSIEGQPFHLHTGEIITLPATRPHAVEAKTRFKILLPMFRV